MSNSENTNQGHTFPINSIDKDNGDNDEVNPVNNGIEELSKEEGRYQSKDNGLGSAGGDTTEDLPTNVQTKFKIENISKDNFTNEKALENNTHDAETTESDVQGSIDINHSKTTEVEQNENEEVLLTEIQDKMTNEEDKQSESNPDISGNKEMTEGNADEKDEWVLILGHDKLKKKVIKKGKGYFTRPTNSQNVTVCWSGSLEDGTLFEEDKEITFTLGDGDVIQAFDLCLPLMEVGEKCILATDSKYAYGSLGRKPDIPEDSPITFDLELIKVDDRPNYNTLPLGEVIDIGKTKREIGNWWYGRSDHISAITSYTRALSILNEGSMKEACEEDVHALKNEQVKCYNNLGACQLKIEAFDAAIRSCVDVLRLEPENVKALFRKGKCLAEKGELEMAITQMRKAIKIEPETKLLHNELSNLVNKQKKQSQNAKEMYQRMLGTNKSKTTATNTSNSPWMLYMGGAVAAVVSVAAFAVYRYMHNL